VRAIVWGGIACGTLDIIAAFVVYGSFGLLPIPLLQGIAAGLLGRASFKGGLTTAALGLLLEYVIAFGAAATYYLASRRLPILVQQTALCGVLYGIVVYYFMNLIVVPLSRAIHYPFSLKMMLIGIAIHIFCVGLPIAIATRRFS
jgi:hypothetical protein